MPRPTCAVLEDLALDPERHDRAGFSCGVTELDDYLHRFASQHLKRDISTVFALVDSVAPSVLPSKCTLSAAEVDAAELREPDRKELPRYPGPCFLHGSDGMSRGPSR